MPSRPDFPNVSPGDPIKADLTNDLGKHIRSQATPWNSNYSQGRENSTGNFPPTVIRPVEVIGELPNDPLTELCDDGCDENDDGILSTPERKLFCIRPRYYDRLDDTWKRDDDVGPWCLDPNAVSTSVGIGDILTAYFDEQSGRFVPIIGGGGATIGFEIVRACCSECWADVIVQESKGSVIGLGGLGTETRCGSTSPETLTACQVRVYDKTNTKCFLSESNDDLVGRSGHATYLTSAAVFNGFAGRLAPNCSVGPHPSCTTMPVTTWSIHSLCCPGDICPS